jgi:very-short-patch-repair endonuclease
MSGAPRKPDTMLETHDRLRGEGFGIVSLISARRVMESRAYFTQWLTARQRSIVVAPDLSISSGLAAYRYRAGRGWQQGPIARFGQSRTPALLFSGPLRESFAIAAEFAAQFPTVPVVVPSSTDAVLDTLLDQTTPTLLVKTALQGLVSVEPEEEKILDTVVKARQLAPLLRSPYEGLVYYMLEARKETRGRFRTNQRVAKVMGRGSHEIDLVAEDVRLVIEIDGEQHRTLMQTRRDMDKQRELEQLGYRVRRFSAVQVAKNPVGVWKLIWEQLQLTPALT